MAATIRDPSSGTGALRTSTTTSSRQSSVPSVAVKIKSQQSISEKERGAVIRFITTQLRRNPVGFRRTDANLQDVIKVQRPQTLQEFREAIYASEDSEDEKAATWAVLEKRINDIYDSYEREGLSRDIFTETTLRDMDLFTRILRNELSWTFFVSDGKGHFVTSDNPVVMPKEGLKNNPKLFFPISPLVCLYAHLPKSGEMRVVEYRPLGWKRVQKINRRIIAGASEAVYASGPTLSARELTTMGSRIWAERLPMTASLQAYIKTKPWRS
jgi:hypothetical protein